MSLQQTTDYLSTIVKNHAKLQAQYSSITESSNKVATQLNHIEESLTTHNEQLDRCLQRLDDIVRQRAEQLDNAKKLSTALDTTISMNYSKYLSSLEQLQQVTVNISSKYQSLSSLSQKTIDTLSSLALRCGKASLDISQLEPQVRDKEDQLHRVKQHIKDVLDELSLVSKSIEDASVNHNHLKDDLSTHENELNSLRSRLKSLESSSAHIHQSLKHEESFASQVKSHCDSLREQYDQLITQHGLGEFCSTNSLATDQGMKQMLDQQIAKEQTLANEYNSLLSDLDQQESLDNELCQDIQDKNKKYETMVKENESLIQQTHQLSYQLNELMNSLSKHSGQQHQISTTLQELERQISTHQQEYETYDKKQESLTHTLHIHQTKLNHLTEQCTSLRLHLENIAAIQTSIADTTSDLGVLTEELNQHKTTLTELKKEMRQEETKSNKEVKSIENDVKKQSKVLESLTQKKETLSNTIKELLAEHPDIDTSNQINDDRDHNEKDHAEAIELLKQTHQQQLSELSSQQKTCSDAMKKFAKQYKAFMRLKNPSTRIERLHNILIEMEEFKESIGPIE